MLQRQRSMGQVPATRGYVDTDVGEFYNSNILIILVLFSAAYFNGICILPQQ